MKNKEHRQKAIEADETVQAIRPMLAGRGHMVQGAILADLTAIWLAGMIVPGEPVATAQMREDMLQFQVEQIRGLIAINEEMILKEREGK